MQTILSNPPTIETRRLILRPLTMADDEAIYAYGKDPEVTKYVLFETHASIEDSRIFISSVLDSYANATEPSTLAIVIKSENLLIGTIGYLNWEKIHKRIEIGYASAREHWNKGYTTEAAQALVDHLFRTTDLVRIEARCEPENIGSWQVMEKIGMRCEGILRKHVFANGRHRDMKLYSILRDDWLLRSIG